MSSSPSSNRQCAFVNSFCTPVTPRTSPNFCPYVAPPRPSFRIRRPKLRMELEVGQKVRVVSSIMMYHYPGRNYDPLDIEGYEGVIVKDIRVTKGVPMTATAPYRVEFPDHPKFKCHLAEHELEVI